MASGEFTVSASQLRKTAQELRELNNQYKTKIEALAGVEAELRTMWEGEANLAFQRAFATDKVSLDHFYTVIEKYVMALENAATEYERAEQRAYEIASTRSN